MSSSRKRAAAASIEGAVAPSSAAAAAADAPPPYSDAVAATPDAKRPKTGSASSAASPTAAASAAGALARSDAPGALKQMLLDTLQPQLERIGRRFIVTPAMALREFERFLEIKQWTQDSEHTKISPTPLMDAVWHATLLETKLYERIEEHIGMRLHHSADGASSDEEATAARKRRLLTMRHLYRARYNALPLERAAFGSGAAFHVIIQELTGDSTQIELHPDDTIATLKQMFFEVEGYTPPDQQRLIFARKQVRNEECALECVSVSELNDSVAHSPFCLSLHLSRFLARCCPCIQLEDGCKLIAYNIQMGSIIHLVPRLRGC
jgi:hypothetical protein